MYSVGVWTIITLSSKNAKKMKKKNRGGAVGLGGGWGGFLGAMVGRYFKHKIIKINSFVF